MGFDSERRVRVIPVIKTKKKLLKEAEERSLSEVDADLARASGRRRFPLEPHSRKMDIDRAIIDRLLDERLRVTGGAR